MRQIQAPLYLNIKHNLFSWLPPLEENQAMLDESDREAAERIARNKQRQLELRARMKAILASIIDSSEMDVGELCRRSFVTPQAVSQWKLNGNITLRSLIDLADMSGRSLDSLVGRNPTDEKVDTRTFIKMQWEHLSAEAQVTLYKVVITECGGATERRKQDVGPPAGVGNRRRVLVRNLSSHGTVAVDPEGEFPKPSPPAAPRPRRTNKKPRRRS